MSETEPVVRRAVPGDAEAIAAVKIRTWQSAYRGQIPNSYLRQLGGGFEQHAETWRARISSPPTDKTEVWVVETGNEVRGFAAIGPARDEDSHFSGEVYAIYISPDCWHQCLGRALFTRATQRLVAMGLSSAILWVLASNAQARRFYEIGGWTHDGGTKLDVRSEGIELQEVRYRIDLRRKHEESS